MSAYDWERGKVLMRYNSNRYSLGSGDERFTIYKGPTPYVILLKYSLTMTPEELLKFAKRVVELLNTSEAAL